MTRSQVFKAVASWYLLAAGFVVSFFVPYILKMAYSYFGAEYPATLTNRLPATTQFLLDNVSLMTCIPLYCAAAAVLGVIFTLRSAGSESRDHYLTMIAAALLHVAATTVIMFVMSFFVFPRAFGAA